MSELRQAAQAVVDRWDTPLWKDAPHTAEFIDRLRAALARSGQAASGSSQGARSDEQGCVACVTCGQPEAPTAAPPSAWDEYAMREADRLWNLPAMPKAQLVASVHCALIDAMRFAAGAPPGWRLQTGQGGFSDDRWVTVRHLASQCGHDFYESSNRLMFNFLSALARSGAGSEEGQ